MAFCVQCGNQVGDGDQFCAKCGVRQKVSAAAGAARPATDPFSGISGRNASVLCYIPWIGWIAAIVVLASERFRQDAKVRFHAFQGLYVFVAWLIVEWVIKPVLYWSDGSIGVHLLQLVIFAAWVFMMIKVSHDESYKLPFIGDLAERSVSEQRS
jgi:uncharacterized membrane protein